MAKVKFGQGVADMRGKVGGSVFSRNTAGAYIREKVSPVNPRTPKQLAIRSHLNTNAKNWAGLSLAVREAWANLARAYPRTDVFGNPVPLTGIALYQSSSLSLQQVESDPLLLSPDNFDVEELLVGDVLISVGGDAAQIVLLNDPPITTQYIYVRMTRGLSAGRKFVTNELRFLGWDTLATWVSSPQTFTIPIPDDFGQLSLGLTYTLHVMALNPVNGALSTGVLRVAQMGA